MLTLLFTLFMLAYGEACSEQCEPDFDYGDACWVDPCGCWEDGVPRDTFPTIICERGLDYPKQIYHSTHTIDYKMLRHEEEGKGGYARELILKILYPFY